jgi:hypothetical protein
MQEYETRPEDRPYHHYPKREEREEIKAVKSRFPFGIVFVLFILGIMIGYFIGARSIGLDLIRVQNLNREMRSRLDSSKENLHTAVQRLDDAEQRMSGELFPNNEAIRQVELAKTNISSFKSTMDNITTDTMAIVDTMQVPWSVQLLSELGLIERGELPLASYNYETE